MLKVMFIDAVNPEIQFRLMPTLGLGYLASSLRNEFGYNHIDIKIVQEDIEQEINGFRPDIIGISSLSTNYGMAIRCARIAKEHGLPVIMGGQHISILPSTLTNDMDVGVIGEGEETIVDLVKLFYDKGNLDRNELENIDGVFFRRDGKLVITNKRKLIAPLDNVLMPARDLLAINEFTNMFTSRGCPYRCMFCSSSRFWDKVRLFSAEYVANEIEHLVKEYNVKTIGLWDDLFVVSKARIKQISNLLKKKGILGKVSFHVQARSNLVDNELAQLLKHMNVTFVGVGLESGCPATLEYLKGDLTIDDHINAINILKDHGIFVAGSFIIGSPKESREDILQTIRFVKEHRLAAGVTCLLTPLPGTPLWDYAKTRGLVSDDMTWSDLDMAFENGKDKAIILSEILTRDELYELYQMFVKERKMLSEQPLVTGENTVETQALQSSVEEKPLRKRRIITIIKMLLRNPLEIPSVLLNAFKARLLRSI